MYDDAMSVAKACERPAKPVKMTRQSRDSSTTPSTAAFLALHAKPEDFKNCCKVLALENQCIPELAARAKELQERMDDREDTDTAAETTTKGHEKKRTIAPREWVVVLEAELTEANAANVQPVGVASRFEADAKEARANLQGLKMLLSKGEQEI